MAIKYQGSEGVNELIQLIHSEFSSRDSIVVNKNITTSWNSKTQDISVEGVTSESIIDIFLSPSATDSQKSQYDALNLKDSGCSNGKFTLKYTGTVNTESIPIVVIVRGK